MKNWFLARKDKLFPLFLIPIIVFLDQLSKRLVLQYIRPEYTYPRSKPFLPGVLDFTYRTNTGGGWSILDGPNERWILLTVSTVGLLCLFVFLVGVPKTPKFMNYAIAMMFGGGVGNMIERVGAGYVIDFLEIRLFSFPTFNIADCFISVGALLLFVWLLFDIGREKRAVKEKSGGEHHDDAPGA